MSLLTAGSSVTIVCFSGAPHLRHRLSPITDADGIGGWSDAEIKRAIVQGLRKDGTPLRPPMGFGYYAKMSDDDIDAVVPPVERDAFMARYKAAAGLAIETLNFAAPTIAPGLRLAT